MGRGRKRLFNPAIPAHIDQAALPRGIYWGDNRWYVLAPHPEDGRPQKRTAAYARARLSELHAIVEEMRSGDRRGSLAALIDLFEKSSEFKELATRTQKDYQWLGKQASAYVLKDGSTLGTQRIAHLTVPAMQRMVETLATGREATRLQPQLPATPTKANQLLRYLRRLFAWGVRHGHCKHNPAKGVRQVKEVADPKMPSHDAFAAVLAFARERGRLIAHTRGSISPYLPAVMVLAYNVRLRGIEIDTLTDAEILPEGILSNRRKGSRDNITAWNPELREAIRWLQQYRQDLVAANGWVTPIRPDQRRLLVNESGQPLTREALASAWQRMIRAAINAKAIAPEQRFSLHGLKHLGITDSEDKAAGGHRTEAMRQRYDHEVPTVQPPRKR
jgi:site-specific recombinase XerD